MTSKARRVITQLFEAFLADERLLPLEHRGRWLGQRNRLPKLCVRALVADYIAGMTDRYAILEHRRLFEPGRGREGRYLPALFEVEVRCDSASNRF